MSHVLDPVKLFDEIAYASALDELEVLLLADPDTPTGRRWDELVALIEGFEIRLGGCRHRGMSRAAA